MDGLNETSTFFLGHPKAARELAGAKAPMRKTGDLVQTAYSEMDVPQRDMAELAKKPRFFSGHEDQVNVPVWAPLADNASIVAPKDIQLRPPWLPWRAASLIPADTVTSTKYSLGPLTQRQSGFAPCNEYKS